MEISNVNQRWHWDIFLTLITDWADQNSIVFVTDSDIKRDIDSFSSSSTCQKLVAEDKKMSSLLRTLWFIMCHFLHCTSILIFASCIWNTIAYEWSVGSFVRQLIWATDHWICLHLFYPNKVLWTLHVSKQYLVSNGQ